MIPAIAFITIMQENVIGIVKNWRRVILQKIVETKMDFLNAVSGGYFLTKIIQLTQGFRNMKSILNFISKAFLIYSFFSGVIRNSVMNADFVAHYQFVQLETNKSSKRLKMIHIKLKVKNLKQFQPKVDSQQTWTCIILMIIDV